MKSCAQEINNNKQNSAVHKQGAYNGIASKYIQKINNQKNKLMILRKESIDKYNAFKED